MQQNDVLEIRGWIVLTHASAGENQKELHQLVTTYVTS
jgi:hypothetical protein